MVCANGRQRGSGGRVEAVENETGCQRASDGFASYHGRVLYHDHRLGHICHAHGVVVTCVFYCWSESILYRYGCELTEVENASLGEEVDDQSLCHLCRLCHHGSLHDLRVLHGSHLSHDRGLGLLDRLDRLDLGARCRGTCSQCHLGLTVPCGGSRRLLWRAGRCQSSFLYDATRGPHLLLLQLKLLRLEHLLWYAHRAVLSAQHQVP
jgi:ferredoxin